MPLLCFASPKGGVGKTMLAANLAHGLARMGRRVVALDLDPQNALRLHFGMPLGNPAGLFAASGPRLDWRNALQATPWGLHLLPHGTAATPQGTAADPMGGQLALVLREMLTDPGLVLVVDTPAGPSQGLMTVLPFASAIVMPLLTDGGSIATLPDIESGRFFGGGTGGALAVSRACFVLNQVEPQARLSLSVARALMQRFGPRLLGIVGRDEAVGEALACGQPVATFAPQSRAAQDLGGVLVLLDGIVAAAEALPRPAGATSTATLLSAAGLPPAAPSFWGQAAASQAAPWGPGTAPQAAPWGPGTAPQAASWGPGTAPQAAPWSPGTAPQAAPWGPGTAPQAAPWGPGTATGASGPPVAPAPGAAWTAGMPSHAPAQGSEAPAQGVTAQAGAAIGHAPPAGSGASPAGPGPGPSLAADPMLQSAPGQDAPLPAASQPPQDPARPIPAAPSGEADPMPHPPPSSRASR